MFMKMKIIYTHELYILIIYTQDWVLVNVGTAVPNLGEGAWAGLAPSPLPIKGPMQQVGYLE